MHITIYQMNDVLNFCVGLIHNGTRLFANKAERQTETDYIQWRKTQYIAIIQ